MQDTTQLTGRMLSYVALGNRFKMEMEDGDIGPLQMVLCVNILSVYITVYCELYGLLESPLQVALLKWANFLVFFGEFLVRIWAETVHPCNIFKGGDKFWRIADVVNLLLNLVPGRYSVFRLMMTFRIIELVMTNSPKLRILLYGCGKGLRVTLLLSILISFIVYMYAIPGTWAFGSYDQFNFRDLRTSMMSLFAFATLEDWSEAYYTNLLGCDVYAGSVYHGNENLTLMSPCIHNASAETFSWRFFTTLYFVSYVVIQIFMANMFIGALTVELSHAYEEVKQELLIRHQNKVRRQNVKLDDEQQHGTHNGAQTNSWWEYDLKNEDSHFINLRMEAGMFIRGAWEQEKQQMPVVMHEMRVIQKKNALSHIRRLAKWFATEQHVSWFISNLILVNAVVLGVAPEQSGCSATNCEEDHAHDFHWAVSWWHLCMCVVFSFDLLCKFSHRGIRFFLDIRQRMSAKPGAAMWSSRQWKLKGVFWAQLLDCAVVMVGFSYPMMLVFRLLQVGHLLNLHALRLPVYTLQQTNANGILIYALLGFAMVSLAMGCIGGAHSHLAY
jgi:hypothetical protein